MAHTENQTHTGFSVHGLISSIGSSIYSALVRLAEARSRTDRIQFLQSLSDDELRKRGLTRDRIVQHVFAGSIW
jgi:hypothetical protein